MADELRLNLLITADASGATATIKGFGATAQADLAKVEGVATDSGTRAGSGFGAGLVAGAVPSLVSLGAAFEGLKLLEFGKSAVEDAVALGRTNAQLAAQIEATGGAANASVGSIDQLSESIAKTQVVSTSATKAGAALLLTFTGVRNEAGKGNDVFDRTLTVAAAISNVFGKDLTSSVLQVGKALQNPLSGINTLARAGIVLDQNTKAHIKSLAEQNDLIGAQKALLDAIESRTLAGGAAAAGADPIQRFRIQFEEFKTGIGEDLKPAATLGINAVEGLVGAFEKLPGPIRATIEAGAGLAVLSGSLLAISHVAGAVGNALGAGASAAAAAAAAEAQTVALGRLVAAGGAASAAQAELNAVVAAGTVDLGVYGAALTKVAATQGALDVANTEAIATQEALNASHTGFLAMASKIGLVGGAVVGATVAFRLLNEKIQETFLSTNKFRFDTATQSLKDLGEAGKITGLVADTLGAHFEKAADAINSVGDQSFADRLGSGAAHILDSTVSGNQDVKNTVNQEKAVKDLDKALAAMAASGGQSGAVASAAFAQISAEAKAAGVSTGSLNKAFDDYIKASKEAGGISPFAGLQGQVELARSQLADLFTSKAQGNPVSEDKITAARERLISVSKQQATVEQQLSAAEAASGDAADGAATGVKTLAQALAELNGTTSGTITALDDLFNGPLGDAQKIIGIADAFDALGAAERKVAEDRANIAGTGDTAKAANQAVVDAREAVTSAGRGVVDANQRLSDSYSHLQDAQDSVSGSLHSLAEAQRELDLYNSARGAEERALELDIIQRRVVTTPAESDQKRLDLLRFQDNNQAKQQQLQDAVTSAQKGYADALKGVESAQRGIADAQRGVEEAAKKERDAQDGVTDALLKQKQVATDAKAALEADLRKVETAGFNALTAISNLSAGTSVSNDQIDKWITKIDAALGRYAPDSPGMKQALASLHALQAASLFDINTDFTGAANPAGSTKGRGSTHNPVPSDEQVAGLHLLGVQGFAEGGKVGGAVGTPQVAVVHGGEQILTPAQQTEGGLKEKETAEKVSTLERVVASIEQLDATEKLPHFAEGGVVPGPPGAAQLAVVHGGERVLTPAQQAAVSIDAPRATLQSAPSVGQKVSGAPAPGLPANATAVAQGGAAGPPGAAASATVAASTDKVLSSVEKVSDRIDSASATDTRSSTNATSIDRALSTIQKNTEQSTAASSTNALSIDRALSTIEKNTAQSTTSASNTTTTSSLDRVLSSVEKTNERTDSTAASEKATASSIERVLSSVQGVTSAASSTSSDTQRSSSIDRVLASVENISDRSTASERSAASERTERVEKTNPAVVTPSLERTLTSVQSVSEHIETAAKLQATAPSSPVSVSGQGAPGPTVPAQSGIAQAAIAPVTSQVERLASTVERSESRADSITKTSADKTIDRVVTALHELTSSKSQEVRLPTFADGGIVPGLPGVPRLVIAHGGERVQTAAQQREGGAQSVMHVEFHGAETPTLAELDYLNRENGWRLARSGRS